MKTNVLFLIGCAGIMTCGRSGPESGAVPEMLQGTIRIAGNEPAVMVMLTRDGQADLVLTGEWRDELRTLDGATVTVDGNPLGDSPIAGFNVASYRIESIGGQRPVVGILVEREGRVWIDGEESVPLSVVPEGLRRALGAKVWVVGQLTDGALLPTSYGILRGAQSDA